MKFIQKTVTANYDDRDQQLRDRIVAGLRSNETRRKLLNTAPLTYQIARAIVIRDEAIQARMLAQAILVNQVHMRQNAGQHRGRRGNPRGRRPNNRNQAYQAPNPNRDQQQPRSQPGGQAGDDCTRCGRKHARCGVLTWTCRKCGKKGRIAKVCRSTRINNVQV